jgi:hypothetical protein
LVVGIVTNVFRGAAAPPWTLKIHVQPVTARMPLHTTFVCGVAFAFGRRGAAVFRTSRSI